MGEEQKLEKKLSTTSVWALAFGCIIGWGAFVMPGDTFLMDAGPLGTLIGMILAIVVMSLISVNYNYMVRLYPVAGGEFKYTQIGIYYADCNECNSVSINWKNLVK